MHQFPEKCVQSYELIPAFHNVTEEMDEWWINLIQIDIKIIYI